MKQTEQTPQELAKSSKYSAVVWQNLIDDLGYNLALDAMNYAELSEQDPYHVAREYNRILGREGRGIDHA